MEGGRGQYDRTPGAGGPRPPGRRGHARHHAPGQRHHGAPHLAGGRAQPRRLPGPGGPRVAGDHELPGLHPAPVELAGRPGPRRQPDLAGHPHLDPPPAGRRRPPGGPPVRRPPARQLLGALHEPPVLPRHPPGTHRRGLPGQPPGGGDGAVHRPGGPHRLHGRRAGRHRPHRGALPHHDALGGRWRRRRHDRGRAGLLGPGGPGRALTLPPSGGPAPPSDGPAPGRDPARPRRAGHGGVDPDAPRRRRPGGPGPPGLRQYPGTSVVHDQEEAVVRVGATGPGSAVVLLAPPGGPRQ